MPMNKNHLNDIIPGLVEKYKKLDSFLEDPEGAGTHVISVVQEALNSTICDLKYFHQETIGGNANRQEINSDKLASDLEEWQKKYEASKKIADPRHHVGV